MKLPRSTHPYLKITGWGWYYLSTVLDDFSRYIVAWKLCATMGAEDVAGLDHVTVGRRPRLLSDNGSSYVAGDLTKWLEDKGIEHVRGAPYHPQTQGKIERWHQTLKNRILLDNYYLPRDLERQVSAFVEHGREIVPPPASDLEIRVSRPREFHPRPLSDPDVILSDHPAPIIQPSARTPASNG